MDALFIGQTYIDVTFVIGHVPTGDEKAVAGEYAVSFGGNAVSANRNGIEPVQHPGDRPVFVELDPGNPINLPWNKHADEKRLHMA